MERYLTPFYLGYLLEEVGPFLVLALREDL